MWASAESFLTSSAYAVLTGQKKKTRQAVACWFSSPNFKHLNSTLLSGEFLSSFHKIISKLNWKSAGCNYCELQILVTMVALFFLKLFAYINNHYLIIVKLRK